MTDSNSTSHKNNGGSANRVTRVNLEEKFALFSELWTPKIVGQVNAMHVKLGKLHGDFVWHSHEHEDELFMVIKGELILRLRDQEDVILRPGEFAVVPRGVEHLPIAKEEVHLLMLEPTSTVNTGSNGGDRTVGTPEWI